MPSSRARAGDTDVDSLQPDLFVISSLTWATAMAGFRLYDSPTFILFPGLTFVLLLLLGCKTGIYLKGFGWFRTGLGAGFLLVWSRAGGLLFSEVPDFGVPRER